MLTNNDFLAIKADSETVNPLGRDVISSLHNEVNRRYILCDINGYKLSFCSLLDYFGLTTLLSQRYISNKKGNMKFLRYPGGKSKLLSFLVNHLPTNKDIKGTYIEPFVGGGSIFFHIKPNNALISDLNSELIALYKGIKLYPHKVWETFESFPSGKKSYYKIRDKGTKGKPLYYKAARTLYLNRTCFKGMWRHNNSGGFNVGYGGEERRWVITHENIIELSKIFRKTEILSDDFEQVILNASKNDFVFLDPPYKPGEKDLHELHYSNGKFLFSEQVRLSETLKRLPKSKCIRWAMTNSSHKEILKLYRGFKITKIPFGTSDKPGIQTKNSNEVLISNY